MTNGTIFYFHIARTILFQVSSAGLWLFVDLLFFFNYVPLFILYSVAFVLLMKFTYFFLSFSTMKWLSQKKSNQKTKNNNQTKWNFCQFRSHAIHIIDAFVSKPIVYYFSSSIFLKQWTLQYAYCMREGGGGVCCFFLLSVASFKVQNERFHLQFQSFFNWNANWKYKSFQCKTRSKNKESHLWCCV